MEIQFECFRKQFAKYKEFASPENYDTILERFNEFESQLLELPEDSLYGMTLINLGSAIMVDLMRAQGLMEHQKSDTESLH